MNWLQFGPPQQKGSDDRRYTLEHYLNIERINTIDVFRYEGGRVAVCVNFGAEEGNWLYGASAEAFLEAFEKAKRSETTI